MKKLLQPRTTSRTARARGARPNHGRISRTLAILGFVLAVGGISHAQSILGSTSSYAVMAGSTVTINGINTFNGNLGAAGLAGAGTKTFSPSGASVGPVSAQNQTDFTRAFSGLAAMSGATDLTGQILGNGVGGISSLTPGVYKFASTAQITGVLTLDGQGQTNAVWVFQIGSTLDTAASSSIVMANAGANSLTNNGLFWQVGSTVNFGADSVFEGNLLVGTSSNLGAGASIAHGRVLTGTGQTITFGGNSVNFVGADSGYSGGLVFTGAGNAISAVPEPSSYALVAGFLALGAILLRRSRGRAPAIA